MTCGLCQLIWRRTNWLSLSAASLQSLRLISVWRSVTTGTTDLWLLYQKNFKAKRVVFAATSMESPMMISPHLSANWQMELLLSDAAGKWQGWWTMPSAEMTVWVAVKVVQADIWPSTLGTASAESSHWKMVHSANAMPLLTQKCTSITVNMIYAWEGATNASFVKPWRVTQMPARQLGSRLKTGWRLHDVVSSALSEFYWYKKIHITFKLELLTWYLCILHIAIFRW